MVLRNTLLSSLPTHELGELTPLLQHIWLRADAQLVGIEERLDYTYFPESAVISVITRGSSGRNCCVGMYGFEGFGSVAALHVPTSPADEIVQSAGYVHQIRTRDLHSVLVLPALRRNTVGHKF
jgi:hypothetical protein